MVTAFFSTSSCIRFSCSADPRQLLVALRELAFDLLLRALRRARTRA
jgi:hypothetical protein